MTIAFFVKPHNLAANDVGKWAAPLPTENTVLKSVLSNSGRFTS